MCFRILIVALLTLQLFSQTFSLEQAESFIQSLITNRDVSNFVDRSQLELSDRLGIQYQGVDNKFLITYDIEDSIKNSIMNNRLDYKLDVIELEEDYSKIVFSVRELNYQKEFHFKGGKYVSPISYYTRDWKRVESEHLIFLISDPTLFNSYCIENLENYFSKIAGLLDFDDAGLKIIENQKIYYLLCKDEEEIKMLTGFLTRGMYNLAYDCVITTFNAHYHELLHLLVNFRLQKLPLYTHPFFQEGFAVAFGGRGGKEPEVILSLGSFLYNSGMIDYPSMLDAETFYRVDASLTYPASGLYNQFLIRRMGIEKYLELYRLYGGTVDQVLKMKIQEDELPDTAAWQRFLGEYSKEKAINIESSTVDAKVVYEGEAAKIVEDSEKYYFDLRDTLLTEPDTIFKEYQSKKFYEIFKNREYRGEKYAILADTNEISVYNLLTNNLVAKYVKSFSDNDSPIFYQNGLYRFSVRKNVFDTDLKKVLPPGNK